MRLFWTSPCSRRYVNGRTLPKLIAVGPSFDHMSAGCHVCTQRSSARATPAPIGASASPTPNPIPRFSRSRRCMPCAPPVDLQTARPAHWHLAGQADIMCLAPVLPTTVTSSSPGSMPRYDCHVGLARDEASSVVQPARLVAARASRSSSLGLLLDDASTTCFHEGM